MNYLQIVCPGCRKTSCTFTVTRYFTCPSCGLEIGKWREKRSHTRLEKHYTSTLKLQNNVYYGHTLDISHTGVKIAYQGKVLDAGKLLDVVVKDINLRRKAEVMWSRQYEADIAHLGLRLI